MKPEKILNPAIKKESIAWILSHLDMYPEVSVKVNDTVDRIDINFHSDVCESWFFQWKNIRKRWIGYIKVDRITFSMIREFMPNFQGSRASCNLMSTIDATKFVASYITRMSLCANRRK